MDGSYEVYNYPIQKWTDYQDFGKLTDQQEDVILVLKVDGSSKWMDQSTLKNNKTPHCGRIERWLEVHSDRRVFS